jgi:dipeptidyl aminopeptidase/acylaminoacyl peptidase
LALLLCAAALPPLRAQNPAGPGPALSSWRPVKTLGQLALSPDGKRLAWVEGGEIHAASLGALDRSQRVTAAHASDDSCAEFAPVWSPDSAALAFFSDCADLGGQADLYLSHLDGKPPLRLSHLLGYVSAPAFSPDGKRIAFLYVEDATRPAGALAAMDSPSGVIGEDHIEVQRVAALSASAAEPLAPVFLTPPNLHVYEFDWSPDSQSLAYVAADPPGENNWWIAKLYTQALPAPSNSSPGASSHESGAPSHESMGAGAPGPSLSETGDSTNQKPIAILSPADVSGPLDGLQIAVPRWSPDAKAIAFIGGLMSDQGSTGGDVWIVDAAGGEPRNLTSGRPASAEWIAWDDDEHIFTLELAGGVHRLVRIRLQGDRASQSLAASFAAPLFAFPGSVGIGAFDRSLAVSADRSLFVFQASTFNQPPEIFAAGPAAAALAPASSSGLTQLSRFNDGIKPSWGDAVSLAWTNDNFQIQGWLLLPAHYDPGKKYPLIVEVHGGPAADVDSRWNGGGGGFSATLYSALGYFVLMPNPRGSFGQGEAFTQANRKDFGYGDLGDILAGVDTVLAKYPVDPGRVGITGWSYGGFMTMFAVTQTHRFRAAVVGAGISDWQSYYGENSIDRWMIPYFGASVYDDPQVYAKSSPIAFIKNVATPTLILVGDRDGECPAPQSFEFWHALRDLHVPTQLVVYPNEGHGFSDPAHRIDAQQRALDWFARYMPPNSGSASASHPASQ